MSGTRQIIHVDMDAFFASVEQRDNPELRGKPVLVGGSRERGVVAAASYEARVFGIHSAMPMAEALRRCPHAIVTGHSNYGEVSEEIFAIFRRYTPLVEGLSLDEAFLDVTDSRALFGDGVIIAERIRADIASEVHLTGSAGVAPCKFAAKIASDLKKPDGLTVVPPDVAGFLAPLPIERMWGVGPKASKKLRGSGFSTIGDLAAGDPEYLETLLGSWGRRVHALANGRDDRDVVSGYAAKSIGAEFTFEKDVYQREDLERALLEQSSRVARRLFAKSLGGHVVTVKVKYADFEQLTRRTTVPQPVYETDSIYAVARELLARFPSTRPVRLTGVSVSELTTGPVQQSLFQAPDSKRRIAVESVSAKIRERFGSRSITRATLLDD